MTVRPITVIGHPALHSPTKRVKKITPEIRTLVADMFATMEAADGVGLAANQVGARWRIFVFDCPDADEVYQRGVVVNPVLQRGIIPPGEADPEADSEGCLSVPGLYFPTARSAQAEVRGTDLDGNPVHIVGSGLLARCLQHETDHLDGHLYVERLSPQQRDLARSAARERAWEARGVRTWDPLSAKAEQV